MLIEILGVIECHLASWTLARSMRSIVWKPLATWNLHPAIRGRLFYCMNNGEVAFEEVCTTKWLFCERTATRTKATDHSTFKVTQSMTILVVLPSKSFGVIIAGLNRAFFGSFVLMSQHMGFEIFEQLATVRICATPFLFRLVAVEVVVVAARVRRLSSRRMIWILWSVRLRGSRRSALGVQTWYRLVWQKIR